MQTRSCAFSHARRSQVLFITDLFPATTAAEWVDYFEKREELRSKTVADILRSGPWLRRQNEVDPFHTFLTGYSLLHAMEVLANSKCRRVPVVDDQGRIQGGHSSLFPSCFAIGRLELTAFALNATHSSLSCACAATGIYTTSMAVSDLRQNMYLLGSGLSRMKVGYICVIVIGLHLRIHGPKATICMHLYMDRWQICASRPACSACVTRTRRSTRFVPWPPQTVSCDTQTRANGVVRHL
jgi:hypothetical protein